MPAFYSLSIKRSAEKEIPNLPREDLRRVIQRIERLAVEPRPSDCEKLAGEDACCRQGDYRVLYAVDDERHVVEVFKVGHRREVYR
ncbi:MAG: type II toxin-antitoxin system RelE family toxin [Blastocatellia bacterium]